MLGIDSEVLALATEWADKAEEDLVAASHLLRMRRNCPIATVCFHAQQCVEKYIKTLLVLNGVDFHRTHQIDLLLSMLPSAMRPRMSAEEQERFTEYAVTARYPGDYDPITRAEAAAALAVARRVRNGVRRRMPPDTQQPGPSDPAE